MYVYRMELENPSRFSSLNLSLYSDLAPGDSRKRRRKQREGRDAGEDSSSSDVMYSDDESGTIDGSSQGNDIRGEEEEEEDDEGDEGNKSIARQTYYRDGKEQAQIQKFAHQLKTSKPLHELGDHSVLPSSGLLLGERARLTSRGPEKNATGIKYPSLSSPSWGGIREAGGDNQSRVQGGAHNINLYNRISTGGAPLSKQQAVRRPAGGSTSALPYPSSIPHSSLVDHSTQRAGGRPAADTLLPSSATRQTASPNSSLEDFIRFSMLVTMNQHPQDASQTGSLPVLPPTLRAPADVDNRLATHNSINGVSSFAPHQGLLLSAVSRTGVAPVPLPSRRSHLILPERPSPSPMSSTVPQQSKEGQSAVSKGQDVTDPLDRPKKN
jgi:hypothetical protein